MSKHTPEPWHKPELPNGEASDIKWVEMKLVDYVRAVACVNACAGMEWPESTIRAAKEVIQEAIDMASADGEWDSRPDWNNVLKALGK